MEVDGDIIKKKKVFEYSSLTAKNIKFVGQVNISLANLLAEVER